MADCTSVRLLRETSPRQSRRVSGAALGILALLGAGVSSAASRDATVTQVRYWSLGEVTRIAIQVSGDFHYRYDRLSNPDRLYFDIDGARPGMVHKGMHVITVGDALVKQIRVAETQPGVTRVVLDLEPHSPAVEFTASQLSHPDRLMVELRLHDKPAPPETSSVSGVKSLIDTPARASDKDLSPAATRADPSVASTGSVPSSINASANPSAPRPARAKLASIATETPTGFPPAGAPSIARPAPRKFQPPPERFEARPAPVVLNPVSPGLPFVAVLMQPADTPLGILGTGLIRRLPPPTTTLVSTTPKSSAPAPVETAKLTRPPLPHAPPQVVRQTAPEPAEEPAEDVRPLPAKISSHGQPSLTRVLGLKLGRVVIDPGHGGHDDGTHGPTGLLEKDVVLDVAKRLGALLEERLGSEVIYTRTDDTYVPLEERTEIANEHKADLFLSIHANSSPYRGVSGVETYYLNFTTSKTALDVAARENAGSERSIFDLREVLQKIAIKDKIDESRAFASRIQASLYAASEKSNSAAKNRGVKKAPFVVLIGADMPSVLAEIGFLTNAHDEALLRKPSQRQKIAEALYKGIAAYADSLSHFDVAKRE
jgi:N-acetylmuramoyl-L-alanine amidase